jgi:ABC-type nitrate/sulfonate/bicarbonate transport system permease component
MLGTLLLLIFIFISLWELKLDKDNVIVIYFGRPTDIIQFVSVQWANILKGAFTTFFIAIVALFLSSIFAITFLYFGLHSNRLINYVEKTAAISQTIPIFVIVTVTYLIEKSLAKTLNIDLGLFVYCLIPVSIALFFPPLVYGIKGVRDIDSSMKANLRLWGINQKKRIQKIYMPHIVPHILTGVRVSSTWAIVATLITEGLIYGVEGSKYSLGRGLFLPFSSMQPNGKTPTLIIISTLLGFTVFFLTGLIQKKIQNRIYGFVLEQEENYPIAG